MNSLKKRKNSSSSSSSESSVSSESSKTVSVKKNNKKEKELLSKKRNYRERNDSNSKDKKKHIKRRKYSSSPDKDDKKRKEKEKERDKEKSRKDTKNPNKSVKEGKNMEDSKSNKLDQKEEKIVKNKTLETKEHINIENTEDNKLQKNTDKITIEKEEAPKQIGINIIKQDTSALTSRAGGVYIPPFKLAMMYEEIRQKNDKNSVEYQKMMFEMLRKSINGIINKVNISNIQNVIFELFNENLIRGKGLLARAIIKAQMSSPNFTHVYASLIAVINTKLPDLAKLIVNRYIIQFQKAYKRNNKIVCMAASKMLAHLVNQQIVHELLALEILALFLEKPTEDSIEMACEFMIECGQVLSEIYPPGVHSIFERFRGILHEGQIDKRVQYTIENLFAIRKTNFKDHPGVIPELDLVPDEEKITHEVSLDDKLDGNDILDIFSFDKDYEKNEEEWLEIKAEILGENQGPQVNEAVEEENEQEEEKDEEVNNNNLNNKIYDFTETDLINLRRTIYLTIISSIDYQECAHKLLKLNMREGQEMELVNMIIECCNQERTYLRFYGLLSAQFCLIKESYKICFERQFEGQYLKIHRLDTNKLRNLAKLFAHLLYSDAIEWYVFRAVKLTEEDTTSSSRIFIKIICQELAEHLGLEKLNERFLDESCQSYFQGLFNKEHPKNTRFCINFFTSIGLGALTEELREFLANAQKMLTENPMLIEDSESDDSSSDDSSNSESSSESNSESK